MDLLSSLTSLVNLILEGQAPELIRPFFGATLVALNKKDGGVRPIAVVCTIRRLAAKCIGNHVMEEMGTILAPHQLGYGTRNGDEAAVHAAHLFLQGMVEDLVVLKLDFKYAFNCIQRDKMLKAVEDLAPIILPFVASAYCSTTSLFWGEKCWTLLRVCSRETPSALSCSVSPLAHYIPT